MYDWFAGSVTKSKQATKSAAVTSRSTGGPKVTPCRSLNVQTVRAGFAVQLSAMSGTAFIAPSGCSSNRTRPWNSWCAICALSVSVTLNGTIDMGSDVSGMLNVPPGLGVPLADAAGPAASPQPAATAPTRMSATAHTNSRPSLMRVMRAP